MANYKAKFISGDPNDGSKDFQITFELYRDGVLLSKYVDAFIGSGFIPTYSYNESKKEIYIKAEDYFYDGFGAWGREGTKYNLPTNDISKYEKINIEGYVFPEKPVNPPAAPPTGDIKAFIDAFNKDFDLKLKSLLDDQQNYKNVYADAIKITTPKEGPWPNDPKVVTIGDLFKYTFPDIESDTLIAPTRYNASDYENYGGFSKDLPNSKDEKISKMYHTISNGIRSNKSIKNYQDLKKPGITNPNLWSPGQYYFDVFMSRMLSPYGPLKDPSAANGGEDAFGGNIIEGGGFLNGWLKSHGGSASVSNFDPIDNITEESTTFGYSIFSQILDGGYDGSGIKYVMDAITGIAIGLGDQSPTPPKSYINLKTQYKTGLLTDFISVENGKIIPKEPTFDISRGDIRNASDKYVDIGQVKLLDITGYKFVGNYEHILLYKAFVQAGDNYKSVVLPYKNPEEPKTTPEPSPTILAKVVEPTATGEVQFKFNVEKTDIFIVVGGTVSPPLELTIVPNDGTQYIMDTFNDDDLGDEYKEDIFAGDDELKSTFEAYLVQIESETGQSFTPEEKTEIAKEMVKYKPGKPSKSPPADVIKAMKDYGITNALEQAHFLAQCAHESGQFAWKREFASGKAYEGRKDLGNTQAGDGVRYKGRGYIQITGRSNYTAYNNYLKSKKINDDVVANPELLEGKFAADCSVWFWCISGPKVNKNFPKRSKQGSSVSDVTQISKWVNGGTNGLQDRIDKFGYYWSVLEKNGTAYS
jgi:putative chitinase